jgi:hypothetical protein
MFFDHVYATLKDRPWEVRFVSLASSPLYQFLPMGALYAPTGGAVPFWPQY